MNPVSFVSWLWKALRGQSVTFAVLLAFGLLGVSAIRWMKVGLDAMGAPWLAVFIVPTVLIGILAKKERVWIPDEKRRKFWARGVVLSAAALSALMAWLRPEPPAPPAKSPSVLAEPVPASDKTPVRPRGPSGK